MKKKARDPEEYNDAAVYKSTDNKQHSNISENNTGNDHENFFQDGAAGATAGESNEESSGADKVVSDVKLTEEKLSEMQDKYIRLSAEFDNYRKRTLREKMELSKYAAEDLFLKILPLMDDFDRALSHIEAANDIVAIKDGINLIHNKFSDFLKQNGIKEIEAMNIGFDVELHDAIAKVAVQEDEQKGKVVDVVQKGYYIRDKVLRHAKVVVGE